MDNTFTDNRGTIADLKVGDDFSVTHITFKKGAVRGNHFHKETAQYDIVLKGKLILRTSWLGEDGNRFYKTEELKKGDYMVLYKDTWHAYQALEEAEIVSTCFGVRVGGNYEQDVHRLTEEQKLL